LYERSVTEEDRVTKYAMLECSGCRRVSLQEHIIIDSEVEVSFYPSPVSRREPDWLLSLATGLRGGARDGELGSLLHEIYQAVRGEQHRLAAMGIRALLEQVMVSKIGDLGSFERQLNAFQDAGYISVIQMDALRATLEVGHAAMHRGFNPTEQDLNIALDVVEGIMAPLYAHHGAAEKMAKRVPPRTSRKP
jgi:Domain of unknown function (DUF4145)